MGVGSGARLIGDMGSKWRGRGVCNTSWVCCVDGRHPRIGDDGQDGKLTRKRRRFHGRVSVPLRCPLGYRWCTPLVSRTPPSSRTQCDPRGRARAGAARGTVVELGRV